MVSTPDFASSNLKLKKRSDFYVGPFFMCSLTANPRVDQQRLDPFRGLNFNIVPLIIKVNRLEVPNSHLGDQQEPLSFCNYFNQYLFICRNIFQNSSYSKKSLIYRSEFWVLQIYFNKFLLYNEIIMSCTLYDLFYCSQFSY